MKKELLVMAAVVGLLATSSAQTYIGSNSVVKVEKGTLFYNGGGMEVKGDEDRIVLNAGNIIVEGKFTSNTAAGDERKGGAFLVNTYDPADQSYGQLIIKRPIAGTTATAGSIGVEKPVIDPANYAWGQFAIPFKDDSRTAADWAKDLFGVNMVFKGDCPAGRACGGSNRTKQSMMVWNNQFFRFDAVPSTSILDPKAYYILNLQDGDAGIKNLMEDGGSLVYKGQPSPDPITIAPTVGYAAVEGKTWGEWKNLGNVYWESYKNYVGDIAEAANDASLIYGKYIYQIGNPYTSNVDLAKSPSILTGAANKISAIAKVADKVEWNTDAGTINQVTTVVTYDGMNWFGDPAKENPLLLRPFEGAIVKLKDKSAFSFTFNDDMKTFDNVSSVTILPKTRNSSKGSFYQLGLALEDKSTQQLNGNRVYVAAGSSMVTGGKRGDHEAAYSDFNDRTGIYLLQENLDETANASEKLFINSINDVDYVGKPIALGFNADRNNKGTYVIKSRLSEGNLALLDAENYTDGSTFYFYDKKKDFVTEVTSDFSYEFTETESTNDRFVIYWNDIPESLGVGEIINKGSTIVYKDGEDHKVRFNKDWKTADISVYDLSGRLVLNKAKVATTADYTVRLPKNISSVYVIKVVGDNGDVVTKKIVKK